MTLVSEAEELVEAVAKGMILGRPALVPLSDQACGVSAVVQRLGDRDFPLGQAKAGLLVERSAVARSGVVPGVRENMELPPETETILLPF